MLSAVPFTPGSGPTSDATVTDNTRIKVLYGPQPISDNGGSEILSYELQMDNGKGGNFTSLIGGTTDSLETTFTTATGITTGVQYRFRYRSRNINGWSDWSPITYIQAATVPSRPPAPAFLSADSTSITFSLSPSTDNKGSDILSYKLWRNQGGVSNTYTLVKTLTVQDTQITLDKTLYSLTPGSIYKFKYQAVNNFGASDFSDEVEAAVSSFPGKPAAPTKVAAESGYYYITLSWLKSADTDLPVIGYNLYMDDGYGGDFTLIYNGQNYPNVLKYTQTGLTTGLKYNFKVAALNFNGEGDQSDAAPFIVCIAPTGFSSPALSSVSQTSMTLAWKAPSSNGGCSISSYKIFMNDGAGGTTYTEVDPLIVENNPSLRSYSITLPAATGATAPVYKFYMEALNVIGSVQTSTVSFVLASVPL